VRCTAALVGVVFLLSSCGQEEDAGTGPSPSPVTAGCPQQLPAAEGAPWVPAPPTTETPGRLVPDADPVEALVCRYDEAGAAAGEVLLEGGLDRIRTDLLVPERVDGAERACTLIGGGVVPHLVRLRYADGELWLSAVQEPNRCSLTGNGAFVSSAHLGERVAQAYDTGSWPVADPDPCAQGGTGRAGQEDALAPAGWTSLVVCADDGSRREVAPDLAAQVVSLLGQLETRPGTNACQGTMTSSSRLVLTYAEGPPVVLRWTPGCDPSLGNGSLSALPTPAQTELLGVLLA
jgi:hypothetical protein